MERSRSAEVFPKKAGSVKHVPGEERRLPLWLFQHQDLIHALENANPVD